MIQTKILGEAVGIQYQGTRDQTETIANEAFTGVIVGRFKRGVIGKAFAVTQSTIKARLGYEPENLNYMAVQDALDTGIPSVYVLRLAG